MNKDWPNLNKYHLKNEALKLATAEPNRIVFIGDSITEFWSKFNPIFFDSKPYINRGISGQTSPQMLIRFRADVIELKPAIVVILAGINDIAGNTGPSTIEMITNNIFSMAELAISNNSKVILCSVLPAIDFSWKSNQFPADKIIKLNASIKNYAEDKGILYLDYYSAMVDEHNGLKHTYSEDGVHPNKSGYSIMEPLIENAIQLTLKSV
jgi:lysophospholipase L1-like esterase